MNGRVAFPYRASFRLGDHVWTSDRIMALTPCDAKNQAFDAFERWRQTQGLPDGWTYEGVRIDR